MSCLYSNSSQLEKKAPLICATECDSNGALTMQLMHHLTGTFARLPRATEERLARQTTYEWPHAFATFDISQAVLRDNYNSNHIHAVIGDHTAALAAACDDLGIESIVLR